MLILDKNPTGSFGLKVRVQVPKNIIEVWSWYPHHYVHVSTIHLSVHPVLSVFCNKCSYKEKQTIHLLLQNTLYIIQYTVRCNEGTNCWWERLIEGNGQFWLLYLFIHRDSNTFIIIHIVRIWNWIGSW